MVIAGWGFIPTRVIVAASKLLDGQFCWNFPATSSASGVERNGSLVLA